jgi:hypothetical protein
MSELSKKDRLRIFISGLWIAIVWIFGNMAMSAPFESSARSTFIFVFGILPVGIFWGYQWVKKGK